MKKTTCPKCKHSWIPRTENPKACPMCKNYMDRKALKKLQYKDPSLWRKNRLIALKESKGICSWCKNERKIKRIDVHHKDGKKNNHSLKNIIVLCSSCHGDAHWELNKKKKQSKKRR